MKKITASNYTKDKLYPAVARAVTAILQRQNYVSPVDVLLENGRITKQHYEDWRFGRILYLERVCQANLGKLGRTLRILEFHCQKLNLKPSQTVYRKWGKGSKRIVLRFSKSGDPNLEAAYSRHYVARVPKGGRTEQAKKTTNALKPDSEVAKLAGRRQGSNQQERSLS